jgi:hypothetical protein
MDVEKSYNGILEKNCSRLWDDEEPKKLECMKRIREISQKAIKEQGLTERGIRKSLGIKRYELPDEE